jgi:hypothetical protein
MNMGPATGSEQVEMKLGDDERPLIAKELAHIRELVPGAD